MTVASTCSAAPAPDVGNQPIAVFGDAARPSEIGRDREEAPEHLSIALHEVGSRADVAPGHEQDVGRRPRRDVADGDDEVVVVDAIGRDLAGHDAAEQDSRRLRRSSSPSRVAGHQSTGFELMRKPIVPTSPAIRYDT